MALNKQILDWYRQNNPESPYIKGNRVMLQHSGVLPLHNVLDIGCGAGEDCKILSSKVAKVFGIDIQPEMIQQAQLINSAPNISYHIGDFMEYSANDNSLDAIVANWSFVYFQDKKALFSKIFQLLKPGGILMFSDSTSPEPYQDPTLGVYKISSSDYITLLKEAGFSNLIYFGEENVMDANGGFINLYRSIFKCNR